MMLADKSKKLRILVVVAHPDDESLWFYGGLRTLSLTNEIDVFCLTYQSDSPRGRELLNATDDLNLKCFFGNLNDTGIDRCLEGVRNVIVSFIDASANHSPYDLIITHPFHGGEKPHPHHLQSYHIVKQECRKRKISFGFFSEKRLPLYQLNETNFQMLFWNQIQYNFWYLMALLKSISVHWKLTGELYMLLKELFDDLLFNHNRFELHSYLIRPSEKISILEKYQSQFYHLINYKSIYNSVEYLYLEVS